MFQRPTVLAFAATFGAMACQDPAAVSEEPGVADSILSAVRSGYGIPGMVAAVIRSDRITGLTASGVRRLGRTAPVTVDDRFHLGSNTKAITATLIAQLVEDGYLSWSSSPLETFPELAQTIHPEHLGISLTQLLQHRAGIEPLLSFGDIPPLSGSPVQQRRSGSRLLLELAPPVPVGSYLYSNGDYAIAAAMAEAQTGRSWEDLVGWRLLSRLGIAASFGWPAARDPDQPWGHEDLGDEFVPHRPDLASDPLRVPPVIAPAGDLSLSVRDYARFVQLHLRGLRGEPRLLSGEGFRRLHTAEGFYAMGWGEIDIEGVRTAVHDGSTGSFWATAWIQPGRDIAVVVLVNAGGERASAAATTAATELLRRYGGAVPASALVAAQQRRR
jgi:CubicO group peptidase (beta-lactamase class C family)